MVWICPFLCATMISNFGFSNRHVLINVIITLKNYIEEGFSLPKIYVLYRLYTFSQITVSFQTICQSAEPLDELIQRSSKLYMK